MMKLVGILLALAAFGTGLLAAYKWYEASKVEVDLGSFEPVVPEMKQLNEMSATWRAMNEAANLNKVAALWTAASVALSALSAVISVVV